MGQIRTLNEEKIIYINDKIYQRSLEKNEIEYSGRDIYSISQWKIERMAEIAVEIAVEIAEKKDERPLKEQILDIAAYYMKNIIVLQAFPDANHRTAFAATELFLEDNGFKAKFDLEECVKFQRRLYSLRLKVYGTYEERSTIILREPDNEVDQFIRQFIKQSLTKMD